MAFDASKNKTKILKHDKEIQTNDTEKNALSW